MIELILVILAIIVYLGVFFFDYYLLKQEIKHQKELLEIHLKRINELSKQIYELKNEKMNGFK